MVFNRRIFGGLLLAASLLFTSGSVLANANQKQYQRGGIQYHRLVSPRKTPLVGIRTPRPTLPTRQAPKKCVPHGQARCIGTPKPDRFYNRYENPLAAQKNIHPRLRANYQHKPVRHY